MSTIGAREANRSFSKILKEAENGETVTITRNGRPVARLVPSATPPKSASLPKAERDKALKKFLAMLEKGFDFGGKGFTRDEMNER